MNEKQRKNLKEWKKLSTNMHQGGRSWGLGNLAVGAVIIIALLIMYLVNFF